MLILSERFLIIHLLSKELKNGLQRFNKDERVSMTKSDQDDPLLLVLKKVVLICGIIVEDRRPNCEELSEMTGLSPTSICRILTNKLNKKKLFAKNRCLICWPKNKRQCESKHSKSSANIAPRRTVPEQNYNWRRNLGVFLGFWAQAAICWMERCWITESWKSSQKARFSESHAHSFLRSTKLPAVLACSCRDKNQRSVL